MGKKPSEFPFNLLSLQHSLFFINTTIKRHRFYSTLRYFSTAHLYGLCQKISHALDNEPLMSNLLSGSFIFSSKKVPDVILSDNQISKSSTRNDEIHCKHQEGRYAPGSGEVQRREGVVEWKLGRWHRAATSDWRSQTSDSLKTASKGNVTEGGTFITRRFKFTGGRVGPPMEKCFGTSPCCPLHCCFLCFFLWCYHLRIEVTAILWQSVQLWEYTVSKHFLHFF